MKSDQKTTSNTILDIQINIQDQFSQQAQALMEYNNCMLCGSEMEFTHTTHFINNQVEEVAHCSVCDVQNKKTHHTLQ